MLAVANGLHEHEQQVEGERGDRREDELAGRELRSRCAGRELRQDQTKGCQRDHRRQRRRRAFGVELGEMPPQRSDQQRQADDPVAGDHHRGEHGVACERLGVGIPRDHQRHDQADLDHGHGDGENERAERLADPLGDDLRMVDRGEHRGDEEGRGDREHQGGRLARPGHRENDQG